MSTFYDPAKVRRLAASGDPFWKGAAWILDQQDAARIDPTDYESEWQPARNGAFEAYLETSAALAEYGDDEPTVPEILAACREGRADLAEERRKIDNRAAREIANIIDAPVANAADLGAPRVP